MELVQSCRVQDLASTYVLRPHLLSWVSWNLRRLVMSTGIPGVSQRPPGPIPGKTRTLLGVTWTCIRWVHGLFGFIGQPSGSQVNHRVLYSTYCNTIYHMPSSLLASSASFPMISGRTAAAWILLSSTYPSLLQYPKHNNARMDSTDRQFRVCDKMSCPLLKTKNQLKLLVDERYWWDSPGMER